MFVRISLLLFLFSQSSKSEATDEIDALSCSFGTDMCQWTLETPPRQSPQLRTQAEWGMGANSSGDFLWVAPTGYVERAIGFLLRYQGVFVMLSPKVHVKTPSIIVNFTFFSDPTSKVHFGLVDGDRRERIYESDKDTLRTNIWNNKKLNVPVSTTKLTQLYFSISLRENLLDDINKRGLVRIRQFSVQADYANMSTVAISTIEPNVTMKHSTVVNTSPYSNSSTSITAPVTSPSIHEQNTTTALGNSTWICNFDEHLCGWNFSENFTDWKIVRNKEKSCLLIKPAFNTTESLKIVSPIIETEAQNIEVHYSFSHKRNETILFGYMSKNDTRILYSSAVQNQFGHNISVNLTKENITSPFQFVFNMLFSTYDSAICMSSIAIQADKPLQGLVPSEAFDIDRERNTTSATTPRQDIQTNTTPGGDSNLHNNRPIIVNVYPYAFQNIFINNFNSSVIFNQQSNKVQ